MLQLGKGSAYNEIMDVHKTAMDEQVEKVQYQKELGIIQLVHRANSYTFVKLKISATIIFYQQRDIPWKMYTSVCNQEYDPMRTCIHIADTYA